MAENTPTPGSWKIPASFQFRAPLDVIKELCRAMAERAIAEDVNDASDTMDHKLRIECSSDLFHLLDRKFDWRYGNGSSVKDTFWYFLKNRVFEIASHYCDPEKAFDFDRYPDLENWTHDSLQERMKEEFIEYKPFISKEKYLIFLYKVLNLCCVRRVELPDLYGSSLYRTSGNGYYYYEIANEGIDVLKSSPYTNGYAVGQKFITLCDEYGYYYFTQFRGKFNTWVENKRPCDITFYAFASSDGVDEFSSCGAANVQKNKWFKAGVPTETSSNTATLVLDYPDSSIPPVVRLERGREKSVGFNYKTWRGQKYAVCYAYAVRDHRKYLKYFER